MVILRSLDDTIQIPLEDGQNLLLGRLPQCDAVLEDGSVSSQHARLHLQDDVLRLVDMDSTNGTRVNYSLIQQPIHLMDGDTVEFGNLTFTVDGPHLAQPPAEAQASREPIVDLDPMDDAEKMGDTMSISLPPPEEMDRDIHQKPEPDTPPPPQASAVPHNTQDPEEEEIDFFDDPVQAAFWVALGLLLASGLLIWIGLWSDPLAF